MPTESTDCARESSSVLPAASNTAPKKMISGVPSSSRSWIDGPAQLHRSLASTDWVCHLTCQPVGRRVNATSPPSTRGATISGVGSPPRSAIATEAVGMMAGDAIVACCSQVRPSMMRSTP